MEINIWDTVKAGAVKVKAAVAKVKAITKNLNEDDWTVMGYCTLGSLAVVAVLGTAIGCIIIGAVAGLMIQNKLTIKGI